MQLRVRRLSPGEIDHELIWLGVSIASAGLAAAWLTIGLPWPRCIFHEITSLPCVTCGMTRCGIQFFHAHFLAALKWNPLVFMALCSVTAFDLYASLVLVTRAPRLRFHFSTPTAKTFLRVSMVLAVALNWTYLLLHWRNF
jgi:Protein of unknown function (DUF2752)